MKRCSHPGCPWQALAATEDAALAQYAEHLVESHSQTVDVEIPDGMVQIRFREDGEWITTTYEEAQKIHDAVHNE